MLLEETRENCQHLKYLSRNWLSHLPWWSSGIVLGQLKVSSSNPPQNIVKLLKKDSQIINDDLWLQFYLLFILWCVRSAGKKS